MCSYTVINKLNKIDAILRVDNAPQQINVRNSSNNAERKYSMPQRLRRDELSTSAVSNAKLSSVLSSSTTRSQRIVYNSVQRAGVRRSANEDANSSPSDGVESLCEKSFSRQRQSSISGTNRTNENQKMNRNMYGVKTETKLLSTSTNGDSFKANQRTNESNELKRIQRNQIYALNDLMSRLEYQNFLDFCKINNIAVHDDV